MVVRFAQWIWTGGWLTMADLKRWSRGEIARMRSEVDRLFDDLCADFDLPVMECRMTGDLDIVEEGNTLVVRLELGNINPDDVVVSVADRLLAISAKSVEVGHGNRRARTFRRELRLPCVIKTEKVVAEFTDGVLVVRLPKCAPGYGQIVKILKKQSYMEMDDGKEEKRLRSTSRQIEMDTGIKATFHQDH
eukprot:TRINITY_DN26653_c0_g1_i1.p1 TRINITY_DN26653_c0_g1~~TRINITY_DN26653_c0_g1_i1.p1  ORF type:complete len:191 (-),score=17.39 TRINITY_DN26653_c0_g1_i1:94-666(-)